MLTLEVVLYILAIPMAIFNGIGFFRMYPSVNNFPTFLIWLIMLVATIYFTVYVIVGAKFLKTLVSSIFNTRYLRHNKASICLKYNYNFNFKDGFYSDIPQYFFSIGALYMDDREIELRNLISTERQIRENYTQITKEEYELYVFTQELINDN